MSGRSDSAIRSPQTNLADLQSHYGFVRPYRCRTRPRRLVVKWPFDRRRTPCSPQITMHFNYHPTHRRQTTTDMANVKSLRLLVSIKSISPTCSLSLSLSVCLSVRLAHPSIWSHMSVISSCSISTRHHYSLSHLLPTLKLKERSYRPNWPGLDWNGLDCTG